MNPARIATASLGLACLLSAQGSHLISPVGMTSTEGNSQNTFPFNGTFHYMQVHGDLRGKVLLMKGMSFRRDGVSSTNGAARVLEIEINLGTADFAKTTSTYSTNFTGTPTQVFKKAKINFPAWPSVVTTPSPWDAKIPFNNGNYLHIGQTDLAWEWLTHSSTSTGYTMADAVSASTRQNGPYTRTGTGCTATGQTRAMVASAYFTSYSTTNQLRFYATTSYGTKTAQAATLFGVTNPNVPFPVCGPARLYTDALISIPGTSSSSGSFNTGTNILLPFNPSYVGLKAYVQTYTADAGMGPLPIAVSNGVEATVPALPPTPAQVHRIYMRNDPSAATGVLATNNGLVTRFDG